MAMFLGGCPVFLIMIIGHWSSDAFLKYICKQVKEFNHDVLQKMLTHMFHRHIPNYLSPTVSNLDPKQRNHPDNAETIINVEGGMARQARCLLLLSSLKHYNYNQTPRNHAYYFIYPTDEPCGTSGDLDVKNGQIISFGADRVGLWVLNVG